VYLVDTNVVSAGAPTKIGPLVTWMDEHSADLYMSAVSIGEIEGGIPKLR
jgi:predicted nucleic acid-binding protein